MIGFIHGQVIEHAPESLIVDVSGVGYELQCSVNTLDTCGAGETVRLHVYTHVREDAITLFGFATKLEKTMFQSLLKVNGVGPKLAIKALSAGPLSHLVEMIEAGDVKGLSSLPKVGKKTAEQIVLALKGKLVAEDASLEAGKRPRGAARGARSEATSALVNLGFRLQDVEKALEELPKELSFEDTLRQGLQALTGPV